MLAVGGDGNVVAKRVDVVSAVGNNWVVGGGLADGDQIIVSGLQMARPGMKVNPKPVGEGAQAPANAANAPAAAAPGG